MSNTAIGAPRRRIIGPVPPRDKAGNLMIDPIMEKRAKLNILGEPDRTKDGSPIEIEVDARHPLDYKLYEQGVQPRKGATDGLTLFDATLVNHDKAVLDPTFRIWGKDERHAESVFKLESGANRWTESDLKIVRVK